MLPGDITKSPYYFAIRKPVTVTMIVITALVFGLLSYRLLPINMMPDISYPSLTVRTEYPGAAPEEVETMITRPLEQSLGVVRKLVEISSSSRAAFSDILLEFDWETDMNQATQDVREKLDLVFLPEDAKTPLILRYDPSLEPMIRIGLTSDSLSLLSLRQIAEDNIKRDLEKLTGVAAVKVKGGEVDEIRISILPNRLDLFNIPIELVSRKLSSENINLAGGSLREGDAEYIIRTLNEFLDVKEIGRIVIRQDADRMIRLEEIASIQRIPKDKTSITHVNDLESVELELYKESDANPIEVSTLVMNRIFGMDREGEKPAIRKEFKGGERGPGRRKLKTLSEVLTQRVKVHVLSNQAEFIRLAVDEVKSAALLGGVLAVIVLLLFLGKLRDTLVVAVVIPVSLVCAFAAMHIAKVSINIMSLGGLALGVGMMVDNAIVVIESIFRRKEAGDDPVRASVHGAKIVGGAVTASTLTTVVVFFPIVFVSGVAGQVFGDMALTVIIALSVSLVTALFFIPMLTTLGASDTVTKQPAEEWRRPRRSNFGIFRKDWSQWWHRTILRRLISAPIVLPYLLLKLILGYVYSLSVSVTYFVLLLLKWLYRRAVFPVFSYLASIFRSGGKGFQGFIRYLTQGYRRLLRSILVHPVLPLAFFTITCISVFLLIAPRLGGELIPTVSQGEFGVRFTLPVGMTVERTASIVSPIAQSVASLDGVKAISTRSGGEQTSAEATQSGSNNAVMTVLLEQGGNLEEREQVVVDSIRALVAEIPSLEMLVTHPTLFTFKQPIEVIIKRDNLEELRLVANEARDRLSRISTLTDIESSIRSGHPELVVRFDRDRLARLGLTALDAAERIQTAVLGDVPTRFREEERRIDIRVQVSADLLKSVENLETMVINPGQPVPVTLAEVANISLREGPAEIKRFSSNRAAIITASIRDTDLKTADIAIREILDGMNLIEGIDYFISGQKREMKDSLDSLTFALMLAIFLVYVVMSSQFESFRYPMLILFTIPLAVTGVIPGLWLLSIPLSIMVFLGLIVLAGIVVNNSIVLVDYANQLIRSGMSISDAVLDAASTRLRPILMTSFTTILALLPMALGVGEGVEMRRPMAVTVILGLLFATIVTLIIIPLFLKLFSRRIRIQPENVPE